ncbi:hypothetical protein LINPERHAP2_LOCUS8635 [Linum perenne]
MSNNFFLVRFTSKKDYAIAAFEGPWKIYDYYIAVSQWSPSFNEDEPIKSILTWVRLPKLPIQYFNSMAVHRIGNFIGKAVRLDLAMLEGSRCRYARVCVELDLTKPLLGTYMIEDRVLKIEYESLENVCFDCGLYGHKKGTCPPPPSQFEEESAIQMTKEPKMQKEQELTGEWMTVQRRNRKKSAKVPNPQSHMGTDGSRSSVVHKAVPAPSNSPAQPVAESRASEQVVVSEEVSQLANFKKVLDKALLGQTLAENSEPNPQGKHKLVSREILRDVSNISNDVPVTQSTKKAAASTGVSKQLDDPLISDEGLIPVKVVYQNPTFQSQVQIARPVKAKGKSALKATIQKVKDPDPSPALLVNTKRSFKKNVSTMIPSVARSGQISTIGNSAVDTRKTPDRS